MENGKISISREHLRAELAELELRLVAVLATKEKVRDHETRIRLIEKWKYMFPSTIIVSITSLIIVLLKIG